MPSSLTTRLNAFIKLPFIWPFGSIFEPFATTGLTWYKIVNRLKGAVKVLATLPAIPPLIRF